MPSFLAFMFSAILRCEVIIRIRPLSSYKIYLDPRFSSVTYHALQDQYLAVSLDFAVEHLCRARKLLRLFGFDFLIRILGSPKRTIFSLPSSQALTTNFLGPSGVRRGLLHFILSLSILAITIDLEALDCRSCVCNQNLTLL